MGINTVSVHRAAGYSKESVSVKRECPPLTVI
jgi:hypothetical protein